MKLSDERLKVLVARRTRNEAQRHNDFLTCKFFRSHPMIEGNPSGRCGCS